MMFSMRTPLSRRHGGGLPSADRFDVRGRRRAGLCVRAQAKQTPEQLKTFAVPEGQLANIASAAIPTGLRLGSGALTHGYSLSIGRDNPAMYAALRLFGFAIKETSAVASLPRPAQPLVLYEYQASPYCRKVREAMAILDLDCLALPCPPGGQAWRPKAKESGGKTQFPFMEDPNTGKKLYESDEIVAYLFKTYGNGMQVPGGLRPGPGTDAALLQAALRRLPNGARRRPSKPPPPQPIEYWGYEASPFCVLVRERLTELELPHLLHTCARGSPKRQAFFEEHGAFQVPFIKDTNTGVELFESNLIVEYLQKTYGAEA